MGSATSTATAPCLDFEQAPEGAAVTVQTSLGKVTGIREGDGSCHFRGVPFAASTGGSNRWKPPQPRQCWEEELDCTKYGPAVAQPADTGLVGMLGGDKYSRPDIGTMGDDCLNLNIVTPDTTACLPVMVWIHGGANKQGSPKGDAVGASPTHTSIWAEAGVVAVSVPYRHGLHGFLHLPALGITNLALRDLLSSLEWIQREIGRFGGDPNNVTLFGQSSGGVNICSLVSCPLAQKLFHRAIIQSGGPNEVSKADYNTYVLPDMKAALAPALKSNGHPLTEASTDAEFLLGLHSLSGQQLADATIKLKALDSLKNKTGRLFNPPNFFAYIGDDVLPDTHLKQVQSGVAAGKVLIVGHASCEASMFNLMLGRLTGPLLKHVLLAPLLRSALGVTTEDEKKMPEGCIKHAVHGLIEGAQALVDARSGVANGTWFGSTEVDGTMLAAQLAWLTPPPTTGAWVRAQATHGPLLQYTLHLSPTDSPKGNFHGVDLPLLFPPRSAAQKRFVSHTFFGRPQFGPSVDSVSRGMIAAWTQFAKSGSNGLSITVDGSTTVEWPEFPQRIVIGSQVSLAESQFSEQSDESKLWAKVMADTGIEPRKERVESASQMGSWKIAIVVVAVAICCGVAYTKM